MSDLPVRVPTWQVMLADHEDYESVRRHELAGWEPIGIYGPKILYRRQSGWTMLDIGSKEPNPYE
jgi:hypothetical protein